MVTAAAAAAARACADWVALRVCQFFPGLNFAIGKESKYPYHSYQGEHARHCWLSAHAPVCPPDLCMLRSELWDEEPTQAQKEQDNL